MLSQILNPDALAALASVVLIDIALAGDNAVVVGMAAAGLPREQRRRAILVGIAAAALLRIVFSVFAVQLLQVIGLLLAGGLLLLWVSYKLWREIRSGTLGKPPHPEPAGGVASVLPDPLDGLVHAPADPPADSPAVSSSGPPAGPPPSKSFRQAVWQIVVADVSMSLDNVLAVAGAAREHEIVLIFGLALSVALMGLAASLISRLLRRFHWIAYAGLAIILWVALRMVWDGGHEVLRAVDASGL